MDYNAWRVTYQSAERAAQVAYRSAQQHLARCEERERENKALAAELREAKRQLGMMRGF